MRRLLLQARRHRRDKSRDDAALATQCLLLLETCGPGPVAAYHPLPTEPGHGALVEVLRATGRRPLLPIALPDGTLAWAFDGPTAPGALGIAEPTGSRYGVSALRECALILVPALGITPRGYRLGKGGGYYDRTLAELSSPRPPVAALAYPEEIRPDIPVEPHDQAVDYLVEPSGWRPQSKEVCSPGSC
ncbi:5-formyltetrahydrofolate cyclo-ligase [Corynebacterium sp. zg-331]|nr:MULTISPECIES: 5-formyltetrahydrofolate cyclo-ligase [unclassified Corynebacterium]MBC3186321.1 5-formyltetrahydrofolate cyclo-ligase [Corynebacterium sp. zg-331]MPV52809.1 5-formyltetrahydrofolate cyclo-ligase [Corynebacterium sp. zg331]